METIRTFTAFGIFDTNHNVTLELIKCNDHYEVRETVWKSNKRLYNAINEYSSYSIAECYYKKVLHEIQEFA